MGRRRSYSCVCAGQASATRNCEFIGPQVSGTSIISGFALRCPGILKRDNACDLQFSLYRFAELFRCSRRRGDSTGVTKTVMSWRSGRRYPARQLMSVPNCPLSPSAKKASFSPPDPASLLYREPNLASITDAERLPLYANETRGTEK